jgi:hypothetical protein
MELYVDASICLHGMLLCCNFFIIPMKLYLNFVNMATSKNCEKFEGESVNRSQMDIKCKICDI